MKATVLHGPGDIRYEGVNDPKIIRPTDAIIEQVAEGYKAMDERRAIKTLLMV
jgi:threonine dehydrogenase-like Zn-dependent dehydrogenase